MSGSVAAPTQPAPIFGKRLLLWDSFKYRLSADVKLYLKSQQILTAGVPAGCSQFVQPADVSWNQPFKCKIIEFFNEWMEKERHEKYKNGNCKPPPPERICEWVRDAWNEIKPELIVESFKICGISTSLDGSEDCMIECFKLEKGWEAGYQQLQNCVEATSQNQNQELDE
eukprot:TRINITY_DN30920_c2_g3_i2.p2 TRINITY_DN30920_c2_g3~~TRINITY_DN30920_c2_g3_i2.p2  ORF type:complete len:170 (-),score=23.40 TRINITY_DN30920_c2_g3_i2:475-984(-)